MTTARPTLIAAFIAAYWDLSRALRALWPHVLIAVLVLFGAFVAAVGVPIRLTYDPTARALIALAIYMLAAALLTPFFISLHRFVLLGESPGRYAVELGNPRFQLFAGWFAVLVLLAGIPSILAAITTPVQHVVYYVGRPPAAEPPASLTVGLFGIALMGFAQCMIILFPAIAVDARGASWQNALRDSRENLVFVGLALLLPQIPVALLGVLVMPIASLAPRGLPLLLTVGTTAMAVLVLMMALAAVVASRLYQVLGNHLNRPLREG
jgi:hypothetical protein